MPISGFATSSLTGGIAAASGEAIGQVTVHGRVTDSTKVTVAGIVGMISGQFSAISQAITGSARRAIVTSASTEVILSPGVANAEEVHQGGVSGEKGDDEKGKGDSNNEEADSV